MLSDYLSIYDPIENTPLIPGYYDSSFGKRRIKTVGCVCRGGKIFGVYRDRKNKLKCIHNRKPIRKNDIFFRKYEDARKFLGLPIRKRSRSRLRSRKGSKKKSKVKVQKRKIGYTIKKGRVVHVYKISGKPGRRYYNGNKLIKGKRCYTTKAKANAALKKAPRKRSPRSGRRKSSFGSWWDNTQLTYCNPGTECANASTLGGKYPFYNDNSDWKPYYPIKGSAFGAGWNPFSKIVKGPKEGPQSLQQFMREDDEPEPESEETKNDKPKGLLSRLKRTKGSWNLPKPKLNEYQEYVQSFKNQLSEPRENEGCGYAQDFENYKNKK